ncbi:MAG TPA: hypothetical protein VHY20_10880, partial [Pirellulales bacterium]|nr:hypothetical protein [Pirellulales bacterium]
MRSNFRVAACWGLAFLAAIASDAWAQSSPTPDKPPEPNYDEAKVPKYTLPELLKLGDGETVTDVEQWTKRRRDALLE